MRCSRLRSPEAAEGLCAAARGAPRSPGETRSFSLSGAPVRKQRGISLWELRFLRYTPPVLPCD